MKASLQRSIERGGPNSLYSRMLRAEITRHETLLKGRAAPEAQPWNARMVR